MRDETSPEIAAWELQRALNQANADRDELSATIERLHDGIDAAILCLDGSQPKGAAARILRNLRTDA